MNRLVSSKFKKPEEVEELQDSHTDHHSSPNNKISLFIQSRTAVTDYWFECRCMCFSQELEIAITI